MAKKKRGQKAAHNKEKPKSDDSKTLNAPQSTGEDNEEANQSYGAAGDSSSINEITGKIKEIAIEEVKSSFNTSENESPDNKEHSSNRYQANYGGARPKEGQKKSRKESMDRPSFGNGEPLAHQENERSQGGSMAGSISPKKAQPLIEIKMEPRRNEWDDLNELVSRPNFCDSGRPIKVIANHFPLKFEIGEVYHYDLDIFPLSNKPENREKEGNKFKSFNNKINRSVFDEAIKQWPIFTKLVPVYDGNKNVFTARKLPISKEEEFILDFACGRAKSYKLVIKPVTKKNKGCMIDLDPLLNFFSSRQQQREIPKEVFLALGTIIRHAPALEYVPVERAFYSKKENFHMLTKSLELWQGFRQSAVIGQKQLLLNVDVANTTFFPAISLLEYVGIILKKNPLKNEPLDFKEIKQLKKELKGLKFFVKHLESQKGKENTIFTIQFQNAQEAIIPLEVDGKKENTPVETYYKNMHNIILKFPKLPVVNFGNDNWPLYYPIELCFIKEGQPYKRKLSDKQTSEIIKFTATTPSDRFNKIKNTLANLDSLMKSHLITKEYKVSFGLEPLSLDARVLDVPEIKYGGEPNTKSSVTPRFGSWNLAAQKFYKAIKMEKWAILSFCERHEFCKQRNHYDCDCDLKIFKSFAENLISAGSHLGMTINNPHPIVRTRSPTDYFFLRQLKEQYPDLTLIYVVLDPFCTDRSEIKLVGDNQVGISTMCIKAINIKNDRKRNDIQFLANICQKMNTKFGGVNSCLDPSKKPTILKRPIILMGADVNHAAPSSEMPSIAAIVGSMDPFFAQYCVSVRVQKTSEKKQRFEIIEKFEDMVKEILQNFLEKNKVKPERIIFYRDGVGNGQFAEVKRDELTMLQNACKKILGQVVPVTFIIVQKRHSTRFNVNQRDAIKSGNIPPGTVIDQTIVSSHKFEFFLCSHSGIQGTSKPAKYSILHDDNNFTSNEIAKLTYFLCHLYARCTRTISIPAPVEYAHHAAFRGKEHLQAAVKQADIDDTASILSLNNFNPQDAIAISDNMYFI